MASQLTDDELSTALAGLPQWRGTRTGIVREVRFASFPAAIEAVRDVAVVAEESDHHPDIDIRWRSVTFRLVTHSAGGVTAADVEMARRIDEVVARAPAD